MHKEAFRKPLQFADIQIELIPKKVRRMNLHVTPGRIWMSVPLRASRTEAERFACTQLSWIRAQRVKFIASGTVADALVDGMLLRFWGRSVRLRLKAVRGRSEIVCKGENLMLSMDLEDSQVTPSAMLQAWFSDQMIQVLPAVCRRWEKVTGQRAASYHIKSMRTRWGSCSLTTRRVYLNVSLVHEAPNWLDYVVAHELTHFLVSNHGTDFWAYMDRFYPDWHVIRREMRK